MRAMARRRRVQLIGIARRPKASFEPRRAKENQFVHLGAKIGNPEQACSIKMMGRLHAT
jgi:hypothetical protein